jgi:hypothetical protein
MNEDPTTELIEVELSSPQDFLKIKETLTRIGVASNKSKRLFQTCHILHKRGRYYITHFKELFRLDGKSTNYSEDDVARRNTIISLLEEWSMLNILEPHRVDAPRVNISKIKILKHYEKDEWELVQKYNIGGN